MSMMDIHLDEDEANVLEFIRGQDACKRGLENKSESESFNRGYAAQYALEAMNNERTKGHE